MKNIILKVKNIDFLLTCLPIFVFPYLLRERILGESLGAINFLGILGIFLLFQRNINKKNNEIKIFNKNESGLYFTFYLIFVLLFTIISFFTNFLSLGEILKYICTLFIPYLLVFVSLSINDFKKYYNIFCRTLLISSTIILICGVLDIFFGASIGKMIAIFYNSESLIYTSQYGTRIVSYMGHPLLSAEIFLICFSFNAIKNINFKEYKNSKIDIYNILICFLGIVLTGSKTAIVLFVLAFLVLYTNLNKIKYLLMGIISIYIAYKLGILDNIITRFIDGLTTGDITTGRNTTLIKLIKDGMLEFKLLNGHSSSYTEALIIALEYPILRWAYRFGILFSLIISIYLFVIPLLKILKVKNKNLLIIILIIILDVNSYSGLTVYSDHVLLYCVSIWMLLGLGKYLLVKEGKKE